MENQKIFLIPLLTFLALADSLGAYGSQGQDFWIAFPHNENIQENLQVLINSTVSTTATVLDPSVGTPQTFPVVPGLTTSVIIQSTTQVGTYDTVIHQAVHVTAPDDVSIYGVNFSTASTDGYLALPTNSLGSSYMVMAYNTNVNAFDPSQFLVVGTQNGTSVTITPSTNAYGHPASVPYTVMLNQGDTYQLGATQISYPYLPDLTGSLIQSSLPVAVFGGSACSKVPNSGNWCNHLLEQYWPITSWGVTFVTIPWATRIGGDTFRFMASTNNTTVSLNGSVIAMLNQGQFHEQMAAGPSFITADHPIFVAQFSNSDNVDGVSNHDPFMVSIPPVDQYMSSYTIGVPNSGSSFPFLHFENVMVPNVEVGSVLLDGAAIPAASFTAIGTSGYSGAALTVTAGTHQLTGPLPFGAIVYGYSSATSLDLDADGYGYPAGLLVANGTPVYSPTPTNTPTSTMTPTTSLTPTQTPTFSPTFTPTFTATWTPSFTPTLTGTPTLTATSTPSSTPTCQIHLWPDPFQPRYAYKHCLKMDCLPSGATVSFYTLSGEKVQTVAESGRTICWDGRNRSGVRVSSGIYFYVVELGGKVLERGKFLIHEESQ